MGTLGLPHMKAEGAPLHPDDIDGELSNKQYLNQLSEYCKWYKLDITKEEAYNFIMSQHE